MAYWAEMSLKEVCKYNKKLTLKAVSTRNNWDKVFKNGPSKICGRQPLKNLK